MSEQSITERLQSHLNSLQEAEAGSSKRLLKGIGASTMLGAGIGGAAKLAGHPGAGFMAGAKQGAKVGVTAALIVGGSVGIANLIKQAREKGAAETKASIRAAVSRAQDNAKLTGTQKAAVKNNAQIAIAKIDQTFKKQNVKEQFDDEGVDNVTADPAEANESLGKRILERLDAIIEDDNMKKAAAGGAVVGAVAGHQIKKHNARKAVSAATKNFSAANKAADSAIKNAGAAKRIYDKETRVANALAQKKPQGIVGKLQNHAARLKQSGRVNQAGKALAEHPNVAKALKNQDKAAKTLKGAKQALRKVGRTGGGLKGAAIGAAIGAGAYGLHKLANKNK